MPLSSWQTLVLQSIKYSGMKVPAAHVDFHKWNTNLNQTASHQQTLSETIRSVHFFRRVRFRFESQTCVSLCDIECSHLREVIRFTAF
jgi:hypothetical protein